jgi:hypothetical protein
MGFDLTTRNFAGRNESTRPLRQGYSDVHCICCFWWNFVHKIRWSKFIQNVFFRPKRMFVKSIPGRRFRAGFRNSLDSEPRSHFRSWRRPRFGLRLRDDQTVARHRHVQLGAELGVFPHHLGPMLWSLFSEIFLPNKLAFFNQCHDPFFE